MQIIIDGDSCPVKENIKKLAIKYSLQVHIFMDSSHVYSDDYFDVHIVSKGKDAADMAIINFMNKGDLIVTGDYGVATMALLKTDYVINPNGFRYTDKNIDELLFKRHITHKARQSKKQMAKIKKRTEEDNLRFEKALECILVNLLN